MEREHSDEWVWEFLAEAGMLRGPLVVRVVREEMVQNGKLVFTKCLHEVLECDPAMLVEAGVRAG